MPEFSEHALKNHVLANCLFSVNDFEDHKEEISDIKNEYEEDYKTYPEDGKVGIKDEPMEYEQAEYEGKSTHNSRGILRRHNIP